MRKSGTLLILVLLAASVYSQDSAELQVAVQCSNQLAMDLYRQFSIEEGNLFFSPYSISCALGLAYAGARRETAKQIASVLHLSAKGEELHAGYAEFQAALEAIQKKGKIQLAMANSLWPQQRYPLLAGFLQVARNSYGAEVNPVDYAADAEMARSRINSWVEEKTSRRISNILPEAPGKDTRLFLANAIYFKGGWVSRFERSATQDMPFHPKADESAGTAMMHQTCDLKYGESEILQLLEMPYSGNQLSMLIVLPRKIEDLKKVEGALTADKLAEWGGRLAERPVDLYLPRFQMSFEADLKEALQALGLRDAFERGRADFSGIDGRRRWLYIGMVAHQAFVDVNEEGTEAAAATVGGGCFAAGTVVVTPDGPRAIQQVEKGMKVFAFDLNTGQWLPAKVRERLSTLYEGDLLEVRAGQVAIQATGNHPFYVMSGEGLERRPAPREVSVEEQRAARAGRWVQARDLQVGDVLMSQIGERLSVTGLASRQAKSTVYNLDVEGFRNYAVTLKGILVHNKGGVERPPVLFRADHPFLFLIRENTAGSILFMGRLRDPSAEVRR